MLQRKRIPFVTLFIVAIAIAIHAYPSAVTCLQYDRAGIAAGETWRLFTGHFTHWNTNHLFWDLLMFVVLGLLIELESKRTLARLIIGSTIAISMFTWLLRPELSSYRGLSGIDTTLFVFVACRHLFDAIGDRQWNQCMVPAVLLGSALGKFSYEALTGSTLFVDSHAAGFTVFLEAHLVGVAIGILAAVVKQERNQTTKGRSTVEIPSVRLTARSFVSCTDSSYQRERVTAISNGSSPTNLRSVPGWRPYRPGSSVSSAVSPPYET